MAAKALPASLKKMMVQKVSNKITEAVEVTTVPMVTPLHDEVIIKNRYLGVNASDINATNGKYYGKVPPFEFGFEGVGEVVAVGSEVKNFQLGQPVVYMCMKAFAEYISLPAREVIQVPAVKPEFVPLIVSGLTASISLDKKGFIKPKETVLITSAAGGTGHLAVQWAKHVGCHVIGTCSSKEKVRFLKSIGCDRAINYKEDDLSEVLKSEYPRGVDVVWETVGGNMFELLYRHLAQRGRLVSVGSISSYQSVDTIKNVQLNNFPARVLVNSLSISGFFMLQYMEYMPNYLAMMTTLCEKGKIKVKLDTGKNTPEGEFRGMGSVTRAIQHLYTGQNIGKVIVSLDD